MARRSPARPDASGPASALDGGPPWSAWRPLPPPADEDDGTVAFELEDGYARFGDGDDWPPQWGAARLGIP